MQYDKNMNKKSSRSLEQLCSVLRVFLWTKIRKGLWNGHLPDGEKHKEIEAGNPRVLLGSGK